MVLEQRCGSISVSVQIFPNPGQHTPVSYSPCLQTWKHIDYHDGCLFMATVHRKSVEELVLADKDALTVRSAFQTDVQREVAAETSGKRRESVGKDSECLSGKTVDHHSGIISIDRHYRTICAAQYSEVTS